MLLVIISHIYIGAQGKCAAVGRKDLIQYLKQGCLAGTVISDNGNVLSALDLETYIREQGLGRKGLA